MMPPLPAWLWIGTRLKFLSWLGNRIVTWAGSLVIWKRFRTKRWVWVGLLLLNLVSLSLLAGFFWFLAHHTASAGQ